MGRNPILAAAALAGLALALAACGGSAGSPSEASGGSTNRERSARTAPGPSSSAPAAPSTTDAPGVAVPAALRFSAPALDGGRIVGADYADTGVALWFWAPW